jgi:hypothetical protein
MKTSSKLPKTLSIEDGNGGIVMTRYGRIEDMDRSFDVEFWQAQDATARLNAGWELVEFYHKLKGDKIARRLQRTVASLQRQPG